MAHKFEGAELGGDKIPKPRKKEELSDKKELSGEFKRFRAGLTGSADWLGTNDFTSHYQELQRSLRSLVIESQEERNICERALQFLSDVNSALNSYQAAQELDIDGLDAASIGVLIDELSTIINVLGSSTRGLSRLKIAFPEADSRGIAMKLATAKRYLSHTKQSLLDLDADKKLEGIGSDLEYDISEFDFGDRVRVRSLDGIKFPYFRAMINHARLEDQIDSLKSKCSTDTSMDSVRRDQLLDSLSVMGDKIGSYIRFHQLMKKVDVSLLDSNLRGKIHGIHDAKLVGIVRPAGSANSSYYLSDLEHPDSDRHRVKMEMHHPIVKMHGHYVGAREVLLSSDFLAFQAALNAFVQVAGDNTHSSLRDLNDKLQSGELVRDITVVKDTLYKMSPGGE